MDYDKTIISLGVAASAAVTLLVYLGTGLFDWALGGSMARVCSATLLAFALFVMLALLMMFTLDRIITRGFTKELNAIAHEYSQTKDADKLHRSLVAMEHTPRLGNEKVAYAINLSTALSALGKPEEALRVLDELTATSAKASEVIAQQRAGIVQRAPSEMMESIQNH